MPIVMAFQQDIDALRRRITKAELDRDMARTAGAQEQYLAAYVLLEALELRLAERLRQSIAEHGRP
jgi:hypothetical protein